MFGFKILEVVTSDCGHLPLDYAWDLGDKFIEERVMEDVTHVFSFPWPFSPFTEDKAFPEISEFVFGELLVSDVLFLFLKQLLKESRVNQK